MKAKHELADLGSCINRALPDEMTFVLLARDMAAPAAIRAWCAERIKLGLNSAFDEQIGEAQAIIYRMEKSRDEIRKELGK